MSFVTGFSCLFVSIFRKVTPDAVRMIAQLAIISTFVIVVDQFLRAYLFNISKTLSVFVSLIITNCIVMGRTESMAKNIPPIPAFLDGFASGLGYGIILFLVAGLREFFGFGQLFGIQLIPTSWYASVEHPHGYQNLGIMVLAPAAFLHPRFFYLDSQYHEKNRQTGVGRTLCGWVITLLNLAGLLIQSIFIQNILLAYFLGMCSYLACSNRVTTANGLGMAVTVVLAASGVLNWLVNEFVTGSGALSWLDPLGINGSEIDLSFLQVIIFISVIGPLCRY